MPNKDDTVYLLAVSEISKAEGETEAWGGYFTSSGLFKVEYLVAKNELLWRPDIRLTMDYPEDYALLLEIFKALYKPGNVFGLRDVITLLNNRPELLEINKEAHQRYLQIIDKLAEKTHNDVMDNLRRRE